MVLVLPQPSAWLTFCAPPPQETEHELALVVTQLGVQARRVALQDRSVPPAGGVHVQLQPPVVVVSTEAVSPSAHRLTGWVASVFPASVPQTPLTLTVTLAVEVRLRLSAQTRV